MVNEKEIVKNIINEIGESFYILDTKQFVNNFEELSNEFNKIYPNTKISYSYKTNYIPRLCSIIEELGGYAEVVSDMEMDIAKKVGVPYNHIIFNGPYKKTSSVEELLIEGGIVNFDSLNDFEIFNLILKKYPEKKFKCGIRCTYDVKDGVNSRFGFDINSYEFRRLLKNINDNPRLELKGIHTHFANRSIDIWKNKIKGLLKLLEVYNLIDLDYISVGGGLYGKMMPELACQFKDAIPTYKDYAEVIAFPIKEFYQYRSNKPILFLEPGSALVGDCMKFVAKVISIKKNSNKEFATLLGSIYNINPTLNTKNPPIDIINLSGQSHFHKNIDLCGFTCIESDFLYKDYTGKIEVNDYVVFHNIGSYSIVLKPPFILPNFCILEIKNELGEYDIVKEKESFEYLFNTYKF